MPPAIPITVTDDLERSRLTVFFRLLLALLPLLWVAVWSLAVFPVAFVGWVLALIEGRLARPIHDFLAAYVRYTVHVSAYLYLIADRFPGFLPKPPGEYPVDVEIPPPGPQNRWTVGFRLLLALPALIVSAALGGGVGG